MKRITVLLIIFYSINSISQNICPGNYNLGILKSQPVSNPSLKSGWHFIHQEEFDGVTDIDNYFWDKSEGHWRETGSLVGMFFQPSNITVNNGRCNLNIIYAPANYTHNGSTYYYYYTSAYMLSKQEYGPGYFWEMKGKRNDVGFKSSFWSFNYNDTEDIQGETHHQKEGISVFDNDFSILNDTRLNFSEVFGYDNNGIGCQNDNYFNNVALIGDIVPAANIVDHTYSLDYQSNEVKMYINNKLIVKNITKVPQSTQNMGFWATNIYWGTTPTINLPSNKMEMDYVRLYKKNEEISTTLSDFCVNQGFTNQNLRPRYIADFNGDGKKDILGFGYQNVKVSLSNITNKNISILPYNDVILNQYTVEQGWSNQEERPRLIGDINGDGKADIVGFGYVNVIASISNSTSSISFLPIQYIGSIYTKEQGWSSLNDFPRLLSDVNGDGKDDIVGFANDGVYISLSNSTATSASFLPMALAVSNFSKLQGWVDQNIRPRFLADLNGDGKKDIIGFGYNSVYVSLSNCTATTVSYTTPFALYNNFTVEQGYLNQNVYPRFVADINGDGKDDIVAFGNQDVNASISTCVGSNVSFSTPTSINSHFSVAQGFVNSNNNPRYVCDINNDKKADIIGFNDAMIQISTSTSVGNTPTFSAYNNFIDDMTNYKQWTGNDIYPRSFSDLNGDGSLDLIGFGYNDVTTSQSIGGTYNLPFTILSSNKTTSNDWDTPNIDGKDVAYKFYIPYPTDISATTCFPETNFWETISIYDMNGTNLGFLNTGKFSTYCSLNINLLPAGYYYIIIDGNNGSVGDFKLNVTGVSHPQRIGHTDSNNLSTTILKNDFSIFPNPNNGTFEYKIDSRALPVNMEIIDVFGKILCNEKISTSNIIINSSIEPGIYFVRITDAFGGSNIKKMIIEK
jgi:hypothetical protein